MPPDAQGGSHARKDTSMHSSVTRAALTPDKRRVILGDLCSLLLRFLGVPLLSVPVQG
jgi:hypothetical protein